MDGQIRGRPGRRWRDSERPDGTLPAFGDTDGASEPATPLVATVRGDATGVLQPWVARPPDQALTVNPSAGSWIKWDGLADWPDPASLGQTLVTWTAPPAPSHKHADELSVLVWSKGVSWLTSVGYWPYDDASRTGAESWSGANATARAERGRCQRPDRQGRRVRVERPTVGGRPRTTVGPGGYEARRQVVHLEPDTWLIVDHVESDPGVGNQTVWQLPANVTATRAAAPGSYRLKAANGVAAQLTLLGSAGTVLTDRRGSRDPFAGWQVVNSVPRPAPAIVVDQPPGDAWTAVVLTTAPSSPAAGTITMSGDGGAEAWTVDVQTAAGTTR